MSNLSMPLSATLISFIILFVYLSKERLRIRENDIYVIMLVCILFDSALVSGIYINAGEGESVTLIRLLNRLDYMMLAGWSLCLYVYTHIVLYRKKVRKADERSTKPMTLMAAVTAIVEAGLILALRLDTISENGIIQVVTGPAVFFTFGCCAVHLVVSLIVILFNLKNATKKILPVFFSLVIAGLCAVIYYFFPGISGVSMGLAIVNLTMYFTIENPDVQMLEAVKLAKEEAMRANQAKTDFLSSMSHEIRTPINAIMGFAECIKHDTTLEASKEDAGDILIAAENLLEIVNGILDISKIEAGRMEVVSKEYDFTDLMEKLLKLIKARIGEKPIELKADLDKSIPGVMYGDEAKIRQIVTNLLTNAVKYTDRGRIDLTVDCTNHDDTAELEIIVSDTGRGIKEEAIAGLFDKFTRLDEDKNSSIEGTGLGLAITKQYVEMLGGFIEVSSTYGKGSQFTFKVSQKIVSMERKVQEKSVEAKKEYPGHTILVVDDSLINQVISKRLLGLCKLDIDTVSSGEECVERCSWKKYDMILLDDMMPGLSGRETLEKLIELPVFDTPVVAFTANAIEGMREEYLNAGYADYLSKPIVREELCRVLDRFLS